MKLSNANALEVDKAAKAALLELSKSFPPGIKYVVAFDTTTVIGDSVKEVVSTLEEAIVIVIAVIFTCSCSTGARRSFPLLRFQFHSLEHLRSLKSLDFPSTP